MSSVNWSLLHGIAARLPNGGLRLLKSGRLISVAPGAECRCARSCWLFGLYRCFAFWGWKAGVSAVVGICHHETNSHGDKIKRFTIWLCGDVFAFCHRVTMKSLFKYLWEMLNCEENLAAKT
jgi:hypothetical protein